MNIDYHPRTFILKEDSGVTAYERLISKVDLQSMKVGCDFTDNIVDSLIRLAAKCMAEIFSARVYCLPSTTIEYSTLKLECFPFCNVLKQVKEDQAYFKDIWLVPCNVSRSHWLLFVVLIKKRRILVLDSSSHPYNVNPQLQVQYSLKIFFFKCTCKQAVSCNVTPCWSEGSRGTDGLVVCWDCTLLNGVGLKHLLFTCLLSTLLFICFLKYAIRFNY